MLSAVLLASVLSGGAAAGSKAPSSSVSRPSRPAAGQTAPAGPRFVGERELKRLVQGEVPVVVEFWASWCAPCRHTSRQMGELAVEFGAGAAVVRVDIDREEYLAYKYRVESLPTVLVLRAGKVVSRTAGAVGADRLRTLVASSGSRTPVAPATAPGPTPAADRGAAGTVALAVRSERTAVESDSYALVINGDSETRHRDNVVLAVEALRKVGVREDRTYVLSSGPGTPGGRVLPPTWAGLKTALRELAGRLDGDDVLTVYVTGHAVDAPGRPLLLLADTEVAPAELARQFLKLRFGRMNFIADHCFSGAFTRTLQKLAGPSRGVVTVAATDPHHEVECTLFARPFWQALSDRTADADGDGTVSVAEAFARAADALARSKGRDRAFAELSGATAQLARFAPVAVESPTLIAAR